MILYGVEENSMNNCKYLSDDEIIGILECLSEESNCYDPFGTIIGMPSIFFKDFMREAAKRLKDKCNE